MRIAIAAIVLAVSSPALAVDPRDTVDWLTRRTVYELQIDEARRSQPVRPNAANLRAGRSGCATGSTT